MGFLVLYAFFITSTPDIYSSISIRTHILVYLKINITGTFARPCGKKIFTQNNNVIFMVLLFSYFNTESAITNFEIAYLKKRSVTYYFYTFFWKFILSTYIVEKIRILVIILILMLLLYVWPSYKVHHNIHQTVPNFEMVYLKKKGR